MGPVAASFTVIFSMQLAAGLDVIQNSIPDWSNFTLQQGTENNEMYNMMCVL